MGLLSLELCSRSGSHRGPHSLLSSVPASLIASAECQDHFMWGAQCLESKCSSTQDSVALAQQFLALPCGDGGSPAHRVWIWGWSLNPVPLSVFQALIVADILYTFVCCSHLLFPPRAVMSYHVMLCHVMSCHGDSFTGSPKTISEGGWPDFYTLCSPKPTKQRPPGFLSTLKLCLPNHLVETD